ncbi:hypothetical protein P5673_026967, partial [Acropora cervicornis]
NYEATSEGQSSRLVVAGDSEATSEGQGTWLAVVGDSVAGYKDPSGNVMTFTYKWNQMVNEQGVHASKPSLSLVYDFSDFSVAND